MKKQEGQNGETEGQHEKNMKDRMEKHEGQNGETGRIEWRNMKDRMEKYKSSDGKGKKDLSVFSNLY